MANELPTVRLVLGGQDLDSEAIARQRRALEQALRENLEGGEVLEPASGPSTPGAKGDPITVATIVLALISSGSVVSLINCFKGIFAREQQLSITVKDAEGKEIKIDEKNVNDPETVKVLERFVKH